ncbi:MAG: hypothetical protein WA453_04175 [Methyloceanibacter sp.]
MAKNAALLMIASLLTRETLFLKNVPRLADVTLLGCNLGNHGVDITAVGKKVGQSTIDRQTFKLKAAEIVNTTAPYEIVSRTRAKLARLGARIDLKGDTAMVTGVKGLTGAQVMATDLRASVSLIIAGLAAQGETMSDSVSPRPRLRAYRGEAPQVRRAFRAALYLASTQAHRLESKKGTMCHEDRSIQRIALCRR